jgi:uncharacterized protein
MSKETMLPAKITDPFRFAENGMRLEGKLLIKSMDRLCTSLSSNVGEVDVNLSFDVDEQKTPFIRGHFAASVMLQCQRCMEPFKYDIVNDLLLGIVRSEEEAEELPDSYDPAMATEENILLIQDIIEDELLIGLPIVPMHNAKECKVKLPLSASSKEAGEMEKENPFKVIELLRTKKS